MLSNETKEFIGLNLKDLFSKPELEKGITGLESYLEYIEAKYNDSYEKIINDYSVTPLLQQKNKIKAFVDIERFLGQMADILHLKDKENIILPSDAKRGTETNPSWSMERLYKVAFELFPREYNLANESIPGNSKNKSVYSEEYHFLNLYYFRNLSSHYNQVNNTNQLTSEHIVSYTQSMLYAMVFLVLKYQSELSEKYNADLKRQFIKSFDIKAYTNEIVCDYERDQRFEYLDTKWDFGTENSNGMTIKAIINEDYSKQIVAFIGEAGTGKTTALKRLEYEYAKKSSKNSFKNIPIFIELKKLRASDSALVKAIIEKLQIPESNAKSILFQEPIILLLDGFNEISDKQFAASIKTEVEGILEANEYLRLFITDRTNKHTQFKVMQTTYFCYLHELSMEEKKRFFEANCKKTSALEVINNQINDELAGNKNPVIQNLKTPYMLAVILAYVEEYGSVPENPIKNYLERLFEREEKEQKDSDDPKHFEKIKIVLAAIACKFENNEFRSLDAQRVIGIIKELFGYKDLDSIECLELAIKMGLLEKSNNLLKFKSKEVCDYFYFYALNEGLDDYFNG